VLPLTEWVEYLQWTLETNEEEDDEDEDDDEDEVGFQIICAECREKKEV